MTKELTVTIGARYDDGTVKTELSPGVFTVDIANNIYISGAIVLAAAREAVSYGEVTAPGYAVFYNVGANPIYLANDLTEAAFAVIPAGQSAQLPIGSTTINAWSTLGSTLRYLILSI